MGGARSDLLPVNKRTGESSTINNRRFPLSISIFFFTSMRFSRYCESISSRFRYIDQLLEKCVAMDESPSEWRLCCSQTSLLRRRDLRTPLASRRFSLFLQVLSFDRRHLPHRWQVGARFGEECSS